MSRLLENKLFLVIALLLAMTLQPSQVFAFNEFQAFIELKSKKQLNCAYCHTNANGPNGNDSGQLGSLSEDEKQLTAYNQFLNSNKELVDSPILNEFGNYLVKKLGYEKITNAQSDLELLVNELKDSDLDHDGISDAEELLDGTLPNDSLDGNPLKLFINNFKKQWIEICFQVVAILLLIISLFKLKT
ncbi:MAG: hypothetical protein HY094_01585 [Candidatus Melainabacteria bacterium]|nr:hypothetical protein [Candidatus Melainabacteria bacterium]